MKRLSPREQKFLIEFLVTQNVPKAAIAAGYTKKMAYSKAYGWLKPDSKQAKPHLIAAYQQYQEAQFKKMEATLETLDEELIALAFTKHKGEMNASDKLKAIELLYKRRGAFRESEGGHKGGPAVQILISIPDNSRDNPEAIEVTGREVKYVE